jgi:hypothetical protein
MLESWNTKVPEFVADDVISYPRTEVPIVDKEEDPAKMTVPPFT